MNDNQRLQLQNMIKANNVEDQTQLIRDLKHSVILRNEVTNMTRLKREYANDQEKLNNELINQCAFLFTYYTDIFNKVKKDEIDINILDKFFDVLRQIEDGELDQHEGSFKVGTILKELYIDSALKKAEKLDEKYDEERVEPKKPELNITWKQFKQIKK